MTEPLDKLLTAGEVAELLDLKPSWVRAAARRRELPCIRLGRYTRFRRDAVLQWLEEREQGGLVRNGRGSG